MGKGERGEMRAGVWGGGVKIQKNTSVIQCCSGEIFFRAKNFLLMTIADSPLLGQSASGLNFNESASGLKAFIPSFSPPLAD
jgi:hypothetical protein